MSRTGLAAGHIHELFVDGIRLDKIAEALKDRRNLQRYVDILLHVRPDDDDVRAFAHRLPEPFGRLTPYRLAIGQAAARCLNGAPDRRRR